MARAEFLSRWYKALFREDCVQVMQLLKEDPRLLKEGWKDNPSREYDGSPLDGPIPQRPTWEGRTALHVGARRGCVELIKQVLLLCNLEAVRNYGVVEELRTASERSGDVVATPGQSDHSDNAKSKGVETNGPNGVGDGTISEDVEDNDREHFEGGQKGSSTRWRPRRTLKTIASSIIPVNRLVQGKRKDTAHLSSKAERSNDHLEQKFGEKEIRQDETAGISDSLKRSNDNLDFSVRREELRELILLKDGFYRVEALAIAAINYNPDIIDLLVYALGECDDPPYGIEEGTLSPKVTDNDRGRSLRLRLRQATAKFITSLDNVSRSEWLTKYSDSNDYNFLPREEYFFHFLWTYRFMPSRVKLWKEVRSLEGSVWQFLLELKDGQGRTPFHVALASAATAVEFVKLFTDDDEDVLICALTANDSAGRSPLHIAAATGAGTGGGIDVILQYLGKYNRVRAMWHTPWRHPLEIKWQFNHELDPEVRGLFGHSPHTDSITNLSTEYGFARDTVAFSPLHAAISHGRYLMAKKMIRKAVDLGWSERDIFYVKEASDDDGTRKKHFENVQEKFIEWGICGFALLLKADIDFMEFLLKEYLPLSKAMLKGDECMPKQSSQEDLAPEQASKVELRKKAFTLKNPWQTLHVVASFGKYKMLRMLLDDPQCDPFIKDFEGNNALHHAMNVRKFSEYTRSILDFVNCYSLKLVITRRETKLQDAKKEDKVVVEEQQIVERQGCVSLLLQAGCDVFTYNNKKEVPYPQGDLIDNAKFCSWWNDKQEKEVVAIQNKLNIASNAISVTAALLATASYVGPLQPPLGYAGDTINQIQYENVFVAIFVFCDTLCFYLAIVAIIIALIPSLPMWQQPIVEEL